MTDGLVPLSVDGRIARVRAELGGTGSDALVVDDLNNIRWCTGFTGSNALLIITGHDATLVTDGRYATQAPDQLSAARADGVAVEIATKLIIAGAQATGNAARVGLEADVISWADQARWEAVADVELVATTGVIRRLRAVKDDAELARMQLAASIVDAALAEAESLLTVGTTECDLAHALEDGMRARGASGPAYETIVASGPNSALPHARPSERAFADGDLVVVDAGAMVEGYRSDMTRTFCIGTAKGEVATIHELVTRAQAAGLAAVRPGIEVGSIDDVCRELITDEGFGEEFSHGTGHGVGLDIHELPAVRRGNTAILQPGHVITVEPGIYVPGLGGVRVEDMVVVTEDGCRPLTQHPKISLS